MKNQYNRTITACFVGYITQAIVNNFVPLLFLTLQRAYAIPLSQITLLVTLNFGVQLLVDLLSVTFVDRIGYRASMILAHALSAAGLALLTVLPEALPNPFAGILCCVVIYAIGGGLLEVLVSVVLLSTAFFRLFSIENWKLMALIWAIIPAANIVAFAKVPIAKLVAEGETGYSLRELLGMKLFWVLMLMMICAGASEQAVSQWASTFAEKGLGISKTAGDLAGPMAFAILMGASRAFYGKHGDRIDLDRFMVGSAALCVGCYLCISLVPSPVVSLIACALCGLSVGIMWPGTFSKAAATLRRGGTALFALLALGGDVGCSGGPTLVGFVSSALGDNLKAGMLAGIAFPLLLLFGVFALKSMKR